MNGRKPHHLVLCGSLALATLSGCRDHSTSHSPSPSPSPSPTEVVSIFVGGQCRVAANTIVCRDTSRSEPQNRLTKISWELIESSTGLSQGVAPSSPSGEISFTGLTATTYQVNQTVSASDGSEQERTYGPLVVGAL
jgi:hypothetical protein